MLRGYHPGISQEQCRSIRVMGVVKTAPLCGYQFDAAL